MLARAVNLSLFYGKKQGLFDINMSVARNKITALIGASGCGKSSFLRCFNRMNDKIAKTQGLVEVGGKDVRSADVVALRKSVGMVFQQPNVFVKSIYENIVYAPRIHGLVGSKADENALVESCLKKVGLFDEVKDKLAQNALALSGGQQQRLCIARALAISPTLLLLDEPTSALDPELVGEVLAVIRDLAHNGMTMVMATHQMDFARALANEILFMEHGVIIEQGTPDELLKPGAQTRTSDFFTKLSEME